MKFSPSNPPDSALIKRWCAAVEDGITEPDFQLRFGLSRRQAEAYATRAGVAMPKRVIKSGVLTKAKGPDQKLKANIQRSLRRGHAKASGLSLGELEAKLAAGERRCPGYSYKAKPAHWTFERGDGPCSTCIPRRKT